MPTPEDRFYSLRAETGRLEQQKRMLEDLQNALYSNNVSEDQQRILEQFQKTSGGAILTLDEAGGAGGAFGSLNAQINYLSKRVEQNVDAMYNLNPDLAAEIYPDFLSADRIKDLRSIYGGGSGSGGGSAPPPETYSFQIGPRGEVIRMGSYGAFEVVDTRPELAQKNVHVQTNSMTGEAWALTLDADGNVTNRTSLGQVAFPEIDPNVKFRFEVLTEAARVEQAWAGLNLTARGQALAAIATDYANQIALGGMQYEEARLNLDRVDRAFTQRRAEREQMLKYAVTRSSLRTNASGETVTRLPFASQLSAILTSATGRQFSPEDFELSVGHIDPEQAYEGVMQGSQFTSPIPGLQQGLASARTAVSSILGQPIGDKALSEQIVNMATAGV